MIEKNTIEEEKKKQREARKKQKLEAQQEQLRQAEEMFARISRGWMVYQHKSGARLYLGRVEAARNQEWLKCVTPLAVVNVSNMRKAAESFAYMSMEDVIVTSIDKDDTVNVDIIKESAIARRNIDEWLKSGYEICLFF